MHAHAHTHSITLSSTLVFYTPPDCCWRHRLWSTDGRKFPALILLTFTVTRHFSAWRSSTHSVTDEALLASAEMSLGASAAHRSAFWLSGTRWPHSANTPQNYGPLFRLNDECLNQPFMSVITALHNTFIKALWGVQKNISLLEKQQFRIQYFEKV